MPGCRISMLRWSCWPCPLRHNSRRMTLNQQRSSPRSVVNLKESTLASTKHSGASTRIGIGAFAIVGCVASADQIGNQDRSWKRASHRIAGSQVCALEQPLTTQADSAMVIGANSRNTVDAP